MSGTAARVTLPKEVLGANEVDELIFVHLTAAKAERSNIDEHGGGSEDEPDVQFSPDPIGLPRSIVPSAHRWRTKHRNPSNPILSD